MVAGVAGVADGVDAAAAGVDAEADWRRCGADWRRSLARGAVIPATCTREGTMGEGRGCEGVHTGRTPPDRDSPSPFARCLKN